MSLYHDSPDYMPLADQLLFGPLEFDDVPNYAPSPWDASDVYIHPSASFAGSPSSWPAPHLPPHDHDFASGPFPIGPAQPTDPFAELEGDYYLARWTHHDDALLLQSPPPPSPVPVPPSPAGSDFDFVAYKDSLHHPLSPFAPQSSPHTPASDSLCDSPCLAPQDLFAQAPPPPPPAPAWARTLWDAPPRTAPMATPRAFAARRTAPLPQPHAQSYTPPAGRAFPFPRAPALPAAHAFHPASAPSQTHTRARAYSQRADSDADAAAPRAAGAPNPDGDATVRKKKRSQTAETLRPAAERALETLPRKSELRPPKLAPSTWQLYFTDWIQRHQMDGDRKLNVAQAAKEAGAEYAGLTPEQKEPFKRRSQAAKDARERELAAWQRTLTPEDIKRENVFRTAQRRAGRSRRGNIKDPNAPKKPLSAYFMFLQHIRADAGRVRAVFGDERETTSQSVLAAHKWRSMTDDERKPFLAQAEKEKLEYEAARRLYEDGTPGFETTISFNVPTGFAIGRAQAPRAGSEFESEIDSEGFATDEGDERPLRT